MEFVSFSLKLIFSIPKCHFLEDPVYSKVRLDGKTAVITGCNTGIGKESALDFYKRGARVLMAWHNLEKAEAAKLDIESKCKDITNMGELVIVKLDLMSLKSVRECAQHILNTEKQVNILLNNAGVMMCPYEKTEDGFETQFATNHLSHFVLTLLLLPRIKNSTPARIVNVSSVAHTLSKIDLDDLNYEKRKYSKVGAYADSKTANILFSKELDSLLKKHQISGINVYSLHPGAITTELQRHQTSGTLYAVKKVMDTFGFLFMKSPELGAQTNIYCSVDEKCANESGLYYSDCVPKKPAAYARNDDNAKKLWEFSSEMVKLEDYNPFITPDPGLMQQSTAL